MLKSSPYFLAAALGFAAMSPSVFAAPVVTIAAVTNPTKTVQGITVGNAYIVTVKTDDGTTFPVVDLSAGSNGIFGKLFQRNNDDRQDHITPTDASTSSADSHFITSPTQFAVVSATEDNNQSPAPSGISTADNYAGYGSYLKGAPTYSPPASSYDVAYVVIGNAPSTGVVPVSALQVTSGLATSLLTVTGTIVLNQVPTNFSQQFGVLTSVPEPACVALIGLGALALTRRRPF